MRKAQIKADLQYEPLAATWLCQVLAINSLGVSHISVHLASGGVNCPFVVDDLFKDVRTMNRALEAWNNVSLQSRGTCKKDDVFFQSQRVGTFIAHYKNLGSLSSRVLRWTQTADHPGPCHTSPVKIWVGDSKANLWKHKPARYEATRKTVTQESPIFWWRSWSCDQLTC